MELLKNFSKLCNNIFPFTDFVYLLQQEEYSLQRVWFWLPRFFFRRNIQKRETLVYTKRARALLAVSIGLFIILNYTAYVLLPYFILWFVFLCLAIPLLILLTNALLNPIYIYLKKRTIAKARAYFKNIRSSAKVVAVAGSYGKTTVKNSIEQFVRASFKTQMIPGNINSTIGIANWILKDFQKGTEVLVVEMDSYMPGRIAASARLVVPDIAIITNVGDQHLQRYKTLGRLAGSLFELFEASPNATIKITNNETKEYLQSIDLKTDDVVTIPPEMQNNSFSQSHNENMKYVIKVAEILGVPREYIDHLALKIILPERRQSRAVIAGFEGIDDSYNISFTTGSAAIIEAKRQADMHHKKLMVITAGIPELGPFEQDKNKKLGELLDQKADMVVVLGSIFAKDIISGISAKEKVYEYKEFYAAINDICQKYDAKEWFLLLQPELTDVYY